jgi:hypothetical protein
MTATTNLGITLPTVGGDDATWGTIENAALQSFDNEYAVTAKGDTAYTILSTDRVVRLTTAFSTSRTFTLPAASGFIATKRLEIVDPVGAVSSTNTLILARAGSDTIETGAAAGATSYTVAAPRQRIILISDGTSKWFLLHEPGYAEVTWTPTAALVTPGTSSIAYTIQSGFSTRKGNQVTVTFNLAFAPTIGTGSGILRIGGLPFAVNTAILAAGALRFINSAFVWPAGTTSLSLSISGSTALEIRGSGSAMDTVVFTNSNLTNTATHQVVGQITYTAA